MKDSSNAVGGGEDLRYAKSSKTGEHHFHCKPCHEWCVIEAVGNVISTVLCPRCRKPMRPVRLIQTRLPLKQAEK